MKKLIQFTLFALGIMFMGKSTVIALEMAVETNLYEEPNEQAAVIATLTAGTPVFSVEATDGVWVKVMYQQMTGYIPVTKVKTFASDELTKEFEQIALENGLLISEIEYIELQRKQKVVWTAIIVILVVMIFAVGIVSAFMKNIKEMEDAGKIVKKHRKQTAIYKQQKH